MQQPPHNHHVCVEFGYIRRSNSSHAGIDRQTNRPNTQLQVGMVSHIHNPSVLLPGSTAQLLPCLEQLLCSLEIDSPNKLSIGFLGVLEGKATCTFPAHSIHKSLLYSQICIAHRLRERERRVTLSSHPHESRAEKFKRAVSLSLPLSIIGGQ